MNKNLLLPSSNSNTWFPLPALENNWYWLFQMGSYSQDIIAGMSSGLVGGDSEFVSSMKSDLIDVYETSFKGFSFKPSTKSELEITIRGAFLGNTAWGYPYLYLYVKTLEEASFLINKTNYIQCWYYYHNELLKSLTFDVYNTYVNEIGNGFIAQFNNEVDLCSFEPSVKFAWCLNI